jgi:UDP-N-acetylglucosamine acyltransferase
MAIHPTAIIDSKAKIAKSADIGPYVIIEGPVEVGEQVKLYPHVYLSGWTQIGDRCIIHPGAVVGHLPQDFHYSGERSYCRIGAGTVIREFASIHRGTQPESWTTLGENCFILGYAHVGHNCELAAGVKLYNNSLIAGHAIIGENTIISGNVVVHQFARIGEYVMIGGSARVLKDVPPYMKGLHESQCVGYNAIGLRRSGKFTKEEINEVREAYSTIFRSSLPFRKAVDGFSAVVRTRAGRNILDFINSPSKLGICGGRDQNAEFSAVDHGGEDDESSELA